MDIAAFTNLGTGAFALFIMWEMYKHSSKRIDDLNERVRTEIMGQLQKNTAAFEKVLDHISTRQ